MEFLDRDILGGFSRMGSLLWAAANTAVGLLLWALGAFVDRPGVHRLWLLVPLLFVCAALLLRRTRPGVGLTIGTIGLALDLVVVGPSVWPVAVYGDLRRGRSGAAAVSPGGRRRGALGASAWAGPAGVARLLAEGLLGVPLVGLYVLVFVTR